MAAATATTAKKNSIRFVISPQIRSRESFGISKLPVLLEDLVRNFRMAWYQFRVHGLQGSFFIIAVQENPIVETRRHDFQRDWIGSLVLPEPTVNTGSRRDECAMALILPNLIIEFISLVIIRSFSAGWFDVRLSMEFEKELVGCGPRVDETAALLHVVLDLDSFTRCQLEFSGVDLVALRLRNECALHFGRSSISRRLQNRRDRGWNFA